MATREIRTAQSHLAAACDICGRTLLRGEHAHLYMEGPERRLVCELCTGRAIQGGWLPEGAEPSSDRRAAGDRRGSLLARLRSRREAIEAPAEPEAADHPRRPVPRPLRRPAAEPRHVRAVPAASEQRIAAALDTFNRSEYPRTVAGVARSLGVPLVAIRPDSSRPSLVFVTVAWELSWYRYEVDLADEDEPVRVGSQGGDLDELLPAELEANALCDANGLLALDT